MKAFIRPEIEINDPSYEWTGQIRTVRNGEAYCGIDGIVRTWHNHCTSVNSHFICRKRFVVPDFVPAGWWLATNDYDVSAIFSEKPECVNGRWTSNGFWMGVNMKFLAAHGVTLPDVRGEKAIWQREVSNG